MVQNRKTDRQFLENVMKNAVEMVIKQGFSVRKAAATHNIKRNTLSGYVKKMRSSSLDDEVRMNPVVVFLGSLGFLGFCERSRKILSVLKKDHQ